MYRKYGPLVKETVGGKTILHVFHLGKRGCPFNYFPIKVVNLNPLNWWPVPYCGFPVDISVMRIRVLFFSLRDCSTRFFGVFFSSNCPTWSYKMPYAFYKIKIRRVIQVFKHFPGVRDTGEMRIFGVPDTGESWVLQL